MRALTRQVWLVQAICKGHHRHPWQSSNCRPGGRLSASLCIRQPVSEDLHVRKGHSILGSLSHVHNSMQRHCNQTPNTAMTNTEQSWGASQDGLRLRMDCKLYFLDTKKQKLAESSSARQFAQLLS